MSYDQYGQSGQSGYQNTPQNQGWASGEADQNAWSGDGAQNQHGQQTQPQPAQQGYPTSQPSAGYAGQGSAGYPDSQASAGYPGSQASAGYPGSQASAAYADQQQGGWAPQQQSTDAAWSGVGNYAQAPAPKKSLFAMVFDFSFNEYATPALAKVLYILGIVIGGLYWLGGAGYVLLLGSIASSSPLGSSEMGGVFVFLSLLALIVGLVPLAFWVISLRMSLEFMLATVKTQQDTAALRAKQGD